MSVTTNLHCVFPGQQRSHVHHGRSLKSCKLQWINTFQRLYCFSRYGSYAEHTTALLIYMTVES